MPETEQLPAGEDVTAEQDEMQLPSLDDDSDLTLPEVEPEPEPEEKEDDPPMPEEPPEIVRDLLPGTAQVWNELPPRTQIKVMNDLAQRMRGQGERAEPEGQAKGKDQPRHGDRTRPVLPEEFAPEPLDLKPLEDLLGIDDSPDTQAAKGALASLIARIQRVERQGYDVGKAALAGLDANSSRLDRYTMEREWETACRTDARLSADVLPDEQFGKVTEKAAEILMPDRGRPRAASAKDAITLALAELGITSGTPAPETAARQDRDTRSRQAAGASTRQGSRAGRTRTQAVNSLDDLDRVYAEEAAKLR